MQLSVLFVLFVCVCKWCKMSVISALENARVIMMNTFVASA
jgi:hypothetical protein